MPHHPDLAGGRVLVIETALPRPAVALVRDGVLLRERVLPEAHGLSASLPPLLAELLSDGEGFAVVAASVGPGSFTGLRAGLATAHGLALASGAALVGVTVGEAFAAALPAGAPLWVATPARPGRVFLEHAGHARAAALSEPPPEEVTRPSPPGACPGGAAGSVPPHPEVPRLAGPAAAAVAGAWAEHGVASEVLAGTGRPPVVAIALAALRRLSGALPPREAWPLYVDPPQAALPRGGLRPPPA